jgi:hypothetical protein
MRDPEGEFELVGGGRVGRKHTMGRDNEKRDVDSP